MYKHLGIDDWLFVALYGAVALSTRGEIEDYIVGVSSG
jgi:hypothetical protein